MLGKPAQEIHSTAATSGNSGFVRVAQDRVAQDRVAQESEAARCGVRESMEPLRGLPGSGKSAFASRAADVEPSRCTGDEARSLSFWDCGRVFADGKWLLI